MEATYDTRTKKLRGWMPVAALLLCFIFTHAQTTAPNPNAAFKIAFSAYQQGNYEVAITNYNLAISIDPNRNYFYYNRGMAYKAMNQPEKAISDFQKSNEYKTTAEAYYQAGVIKYQKADIDGAKTEFENAKLIREDIENMNFYLGMIYYRGNRFEEATKCFYDYTARVKTNPEAYYYRALCEAKIGRYAEAIASFKFEMNYKTNDWKIFYNMFEIYLAMNDKPNAINCLSMVLELGEKKAEYYEERARLYLDIGDNFKYEDDLRSAKELKAAETGEAKTGL